MSSDSLECVTEVLLVAGESSHLSVVDDQLEERVHEEDPVWQDAAAVQEHGLWREHHSLHQRTHYVDSHYQKKRMSKLF